MDLFEQAKALLESYEEQLLSVGIHCTLSRRYFETAVDERTSYSQSAILDDMERALYRRTEKKRGYGHQRNRYHLLVLRLTPKDVKSKNTFPGKEYAFAVKKIARAHVGLVPEETSLGNEKVLAKLEKRIHKILKNGNKKPAHLVCSETHLDILGRYLLSGKYGYKKRARGKDMSYWHICLIVSVGVLALLSVAVGWILTS